jgi:uncharacterized membrane protein HdeD (DUF308 family)
MTTTNTVRAGTREDPRVEMLAEMGLENVRLVGIVLILLGVGALIAPAVAGTSVSLLVGVLLLAAGISKLVRVFRSRHWRLQWESILLGILAAIAGGLFITRPFVGLSALTLTIVLYFAASGVVQTVWWWRLRRDLGALWTLLSGAMTLLLAALIGLQWPLSGLWAVGTLVGVHFLFGGASLITLGSPPRGKKESGDAGSEPDEA